MNTATLCRSQRTYILFLIIILPLFGSVTLANSDNTGYMEDICCNGGPYAIRLPKSVKALRTIGKLKSERVIEIEKVMGTEDRELIYEGLRLIIVIAEDDKQHYSVVRVNITSPSWEIIPNFRVGDTIESVNKHFDGKARKVGNWLEVGGDTDTLRFRISNGKVSEIEYLCFRG